MAEKISLLGRNVRIEFAEPPHGSRDDILSDLDVMSALINRTEWPPEYAAAYRLLTKVVMFSDRVTVNGHVMSRSCCDEDDAVFYWEIDEEFLANRDADVHGHTLFHDCWHVVQFRRDGGFARGHVQVAREVEAINHQIKVAQLLGCDDREIQFLRDFRDDQNRLLARLEEGVHTRMPTAQV